MEGSEGGGLCCYLGEQHPREWISKCKGHKVGVCWNEEGTARKVSWVWKTRSLENDRREDIRSC